MWNYRYFSNSFLTYISKPSMKRRKKRKETICLKTFNKIKLPFFVRAKMGSISSRHVLKLCIFSKRTMIREIIGRLLKVLLTVSWKTKAPSFIHFFTIHPLAFMVHRHFGFVIFYGPNFCWQTFYFYALLNLGKFSGTAQMIRVCKMAGIYKFLLLGCRCILWHLWG